jgi:predicted RNA methylase
MMVVPPGPIARALADAVITEMLKRDPDRVVRVVATVVEQFKNERRYCPEEIEAAAALVCRDLGIPWASRLN